MCQPAIDDNELRIVVQSKAMKCTLILLSAVIAACCGGSPGEDLPLAGPFGVCPPEDGKTPVYLLDHKNIYAFYECSNGEPHIQFCTGNLVFNPKMEICDFLSDEWEAYGAVGHCPATNPTYPLFLRDGMSRKVFYMCNDGKAMKRECADNLVFDPYRESCSRW